MIFEALPARYGDCLFLTFAGKDRPLRLLIDGGPSGVFRTSLKKRLDDEVKRFPQEKPLNIDAVMVSHIDEDHIFGILDLLGSVQDAVQRQTKPPYQPKYLLHNSFDALTGEGEGGAGRALGGNTVLASLADGLELPEGGLKSHTAELVLASYGQGSKLSTLAAALHIARNPPDQRVLSYEDGKPRVLQFGDATLTVVGPLQAEIDKLRDEWRKWKAKQTGAAALASYIDKSVPNLSSIVVMLEWKKHRLLLTGDARGDHVMTGLEKAGYLKPKGKMKVDVFKLPHHGSINNIDLDMLQRIEADHYIASGDGTYGNPDRATLELIEKARPAGGYTVHLTYDAASCDTVHEGWGATRKGQEYNAKKHSIAEVVARWRKEGKITVKEGPVTLDFT